MTYIWRFLVWLDYTVNDKWLKGRWESISSRTYRNHRRCKRAAWLMRMLDAVDKNHCEKMYLKDTSANTSIPRVNWEVPINKNQKC